MTFEVIPDTYLALLACWATPLLWYGFSPSELSMGQRIRTILPQTATQLVPKLPKEQSFKEKQEVYDRHHWVRDLPTLPSETGVWVTSGTHYKRKRDFGPGWVTTNIPSGHASWNWLLHLLHLGVVLGNPSPSSGYDQPLPQRKAVTHL